MRRLLALPVLVSLLATAAAQDLRPVAFTNARLLPIEGAAIERGTLVVKDGVIQALGKDVAPPAGAVLVDCQGGTVMPGLVSAFSRAGLAGEARPAPSPDGGRRGRRGGGAPPVEAPRGGGAQNQAATKVVERLDAKQNVFGELLRAGVTTLSLVPTGGGFPGLGAVLAPDGKNLETLTADDDAFVFVGMARDAAVKKTLKEAFDKAKKVVEERKKPKEQPKAPEPKPEDKPADKPADKTEPPKPGDTPPKPEPKPEPKPPEPKPDEKKDAQGQPQPAAAAKPEEPKDPNIEVLADLLEGKRRAIVQIDSAADLLHWTHAVGEELSFPRAIAVSRYDPLAGTVEDVLEQLKKFKVAVLLPAELSTRPRTRYLTHPARTLHDAGVEIAFATGDNKDSVRLLFFRLLELVRYGLPADTALAAVTLVPAKILGVDAQVGSLKPGKKANLLLFSGDPLDPTSELKSVWLHGRLVEPNTP